MLACSLKASFLYKVCSKFINLFKSWKWAKNKYTQATDSFLFLLEGMYTKFSLTLRAEIIGKYAINFIIFEVVLGRNHRAVSVQINQCIRFFLENLINSKTE